MRKNRDKILQQERDGRKKLFFIGVFGMFILLPFNWNFNLVVSGTKKKAKVVHIHEWLIDEPHFFEVEFLREVEQGEELVKLKLRDYTGGDPPMFIKDRGEPPLLFFIDEGDMLTIYESKDKPWKYYVPFLSFMPKLLIFTFFVFVPFFFMLFGRIYA